MAAALVHAALFLALFLPRPPALPGLQFDDRAPGMSVSLVRWNTSSSPAPSPSRSEAERLEQLRQSLAGSAPAEAPSPSPASKPAVDASAILAAFDNARPPPLAGATASQATVAKPAGSGAVIEDPFGGAAAPPAYLRAADGVALWPQLTRCWRPIRAQPRVELLVTLDEHGQLAEAPGVVREASARVDDLRLRAEAEAIRAAKACAPYTTAGTQRSFRLAFAAQPGSRN